MGSGFPIHRIIMIYPEIKKRFRINSDQYSVIESVRILSSTEGHPWCTQKKEEIGRFCTVSRPTVFRTISIALKKGLIVHHPERHEWVKTTPLWDELVLGLRSIWEKEKNGSDAASLKVRLTSELQGESQIETGGLSGQSQIKTEQSQNETIESQIKIEQSQNETPYNNKKNDQNENNTLHQNFQNPKEEKSELERLLETLSEKDQRYYYAKAEFELSGYKTQMTPDAYQQTVQIVALREFGKSQE